MKFYVVEYKYEPADEPMYDVYKHMEEAEEAVKRSSTEFQRILEVEVTKKFIVSHSISLEEVQ